MRARLYWQDGTVEDFELDDPTVTTIVRHGTDGKHRHFNAADQPDDEGVERFIEEDAPSDEGRGI